MGVLVVINTFCLIFTTCSIRRLSRGTSMKLASSRGFRRAPATTRARRHGDSFT
ncbi:Protein of unknown function [Gryllus bimaculatus]|nr:Protein of unknown function [Gryllus bimaculatus]